MNAVVHDCVPTFFLNLRHRFAQKWFCEWCVVSDVHAYVYVGTVDDNCACAHALLQLWRDLGGAQEEETL